jgi:hypothetical protein
VSVVQPSRLLDIGPPASSLRAVRDDNPLPAMRRNVRVQPDGLCAVVFRQIGKEDRAMLSVEAIQERPMPLLSTIKQG